MTTNQGTPSSSVLGNIDVESLRRILGETPASELHRRHPHEIRSLLEEAGSEVPNFLLDKDDDGHVAPHTAALELLLRNSRTSPSRRPALPLVPAALMALICQVVLEVLGGAGAIWGCGELLRLRKGGNTHPSWDIFSWLAFVVGICCAFRFALIHHVSRNDPSFLDRNPHFDDARVTFLDRARCVAKEPILFLHPTKGAFSPSLGDLSIQMTNFSLC